MSITLQVQEEQTESVLETYHQLKNVALLTFKIHVRIFISISDGLIISLVVKCQSMSLLITQTKQCINNIPLI